MTWQGAAGGCNADGSLSLTGSLSLAHTHTLSLSLTLTFSFSLSAKGGWRPRRRLLSFSHRLTRSHSLTHTFSLSHACPLSVSLSLCLSLCLSLSFCRGRLAAATPISELTDPNYHLASISVEKRSLIYIQVVCVRECVCEYVRVSVCEWVRVRE